MLRHVLKSKVLFFIELYLKNQQLQEQAELIRKNERYSNLADSIPHIVWNARANGVFDYFNKVWFDYTGLSNKNNLYFVWQASVHPDDLKSFLKTWSVAVQSRDPFQTECRIRRRDGEMRWHWVRAVPEIQDDAVVAWLGTCTDIHAQKLSELRLIEAERLAVAANVAKTNFLANMSHEIRTPMCAILGFTELMMNEDQSPEERLQFISIVHRSGRQLLRVIDEILDISKVEAGRLEVETLEVDFAELLADISTLMSGQAREKNLQFEVNFISEIPARLHTDPVRLRQILINIVGNAIKFTEKGTVRLDVDYVPGKPFGKTLIRVSDTGIGIDPAQASRLFRPFTQIDASTTRKFGGAGLGLALSKKLAQALGGNLMLESSEEGKGSTFLIEIQAGVVKGSPRFKNLDLRISPPDLAGTENVEALKNVNMLLVVDAPDNQKLISRIQAASS